MTRVAALAAAALAAFLMPVAQAQQSPVVCQPHGAVKAKLLRQYGEILVARGLAGGTALLEIYASRSGSFTVLLTRPEMRGLTCIQGAGQDFALTGNKYPPKGKKS
jgi:hypothetical protein|tara:strand:- start:296 stop:613 length:318 start_codon:yes stop_codon:yes gene_type:complete